MELISNWKAMIWSLVASPKLTVVLPAAGVDVIEDLPPPLQPTTAKMTPESKANTARFI